jgi:prevent-host-death family protein
MVMLPARITATQFKARCLRLLDEVAETGKPLEITKRGEVVARLEPPDRDIPDLAGSITFHLTDDELVDSSMGAWEVEE